VRALSLGRLGFVDAGGQKDSQADSQNNENEEQTPPRLALGTKLDICGICHRCAGPHPNPLPDYRERG